MYRALLEEFDAAVKLGSRAILLRSGLRHFSAGAEVSLFPDRIERQGKGLVDPLEVLRAFETLPVPIVAAVNGTCLGGGFEVVLACDYSVVAESAKIRSRSRSRSACISCLAVSSAGWCARNRPRQGESCSAVAMTRQRLNAGA
jgi:hypothetical protein